MSDLFILKNKDSQYQLARSFVLLSKQIDTCYRLHGETETSIGVIRNIVSQFCKHQLDKRTFKHELTGILRSSNKAKEHKICRLIFSKRLKVSLHIAPFKTTFPQHQHPNTINILIPVTGNLFVTQYNPRNNKTTLLKARDCAIGLKQRYNQHSLSVTSPSSVFFSLRLSPPGSVLQKLKAKLVYAFGFLLFPVYTNVGLATEMSDSDCGELSALVSQHFAATLEPTRTADSDSIVAQANQIRRESDDDGMLFTAASLYEKAALQNHPEAQYWLGYMSLRGIGITEDSDKALHWIAASSNQQYPPAQKLLDYILTHEPALDC